MKELEDYRWFPSVLRNFQTEFIGFVVARFNVYDVFIHHLNSLHLPVQSMTDLCSGSGEPAISIFRKSNCFSRLSLSDKFPNALKFKENTISYEIQSSDVLAMEFHHGTYYTMFNAFHHFSDEEKVMIVQKIRDSGSAAFIVEVLEPTIFCLLKILLTTTIGNLLLTSFVRPFSIRRLVFTYLLPVNLLTISFDGIVSVLKSRSVQQYQRLFATMENAPNTYRLRNGLVTLIIIQIEPEQ